MSIRPKPFIAACAHGRWSRIFHLRSDALRLGIDIVAECPLCGSMDLVHRRPTFTEAVPLALAAFLKCPSL